MADAFVPNKAQREAVEFPTDRPLKVLAGAGAGKTAVLTQRFIHIVEKHGISPHRILALTFTKKAASEMHGRITNGLLEKGLIRRSEAPLLLWIGNFHSICLRLLRQSPLVVGLDPSFMVIEETGQRMLLSEVVHDFLDKKLNSVADPDGFEALMIDRADRFALNVLPVIVRIKDHFITAAHLKQSAGAIMSEQYRTIESNLNETIGNEAIHRNTRRAAEKRLAALPAAMAHERLLLDAINEILSEYQRRLEQHNLLDFGDLIFHAYRLAKLDTSVKNRFDYILVDEFQDTDYGQYRLLHALSNDFRNVTIVGDKKQSIYEWREARIENTDNFPGETIVLDENYRSYGEVLDAANFLISRSMPSERALAPASQGGRGRADAACVRLFRANDQAEEAEYVAREIARLLEPENRDPGEIAVLMRSVRASRPYEDALKANGIGYTTVGGCGFYDLCETKDVLALLRLVFDPFDDLSMTRTLQSAIVGLSDATLHELCRHRNESAPSIYDVLKGADGLLERFRPRSRARLQQLVTAIDELADARWSLTIGEIVSEMLARTGYLNYLSSLEGPRGARFSNVARFYRIATSFEERQPGADLEEFLSYMETAVLSGAEAVPVEARTDAVQIMTIHQAKGLEFAAVFVVNLRPGAFPLKFRSDGFGYHEDFGLFASKLPDGDDIVRYQGGYGIGIREDLKRRHLLEENRIMYVAMTRAKEVLYLTTSATGNGKSDDLFRLVEEFASATGNRSVEVVTPVSAAPRPPRPERETRAGVSIEEIKGLAVEAVERMHRPSLLAATEDAANVTVLSYSRLAAFRRCPTQYALRYLYNLPLAPHEEPEDEPYPHEDVNARMLGILLHKTLMQYHRKKKAGAPADAYSIFAGLSRALDCAGDMVQAGNEMIGRYLAAPLSQVETLCEEKEFHWRIADGPLHVMFEGKVDRIHREGDRLKIVDYKTGARDETNHRLQLGIYRMAMEAVFGEEGILASSFYLSAGEEVEYDFSKRELQEIRTGILEDARRIAGGGVGAVETGKAAIADCAGCAYRTFCPRQRDDIRSVNSG